MFSSNQTHYVLAFETKASQVGNSIKTKVLRQVFEFLFQQNSQRMDARTRFEYLVYGFTRNAEKAYKLFMNIDLGIYRIIHEFYPKLLRFKSYSSKHFKGSDDGETIKGNNYYDCNGYMAYAESPNDEGFNHGIHYWSDSFDAMFQQRMHQSMKDKNDRE